MGEGLLVVGVTHTAFHLDGLGNVVGQVQVGRPAFVIAYKFPGFLQQAVTAGVPLVTVVIEQVATTGGVQAVVGITVVLTVQLLLTGEAVFGLDILLVVGDTCIPRKWTILL